MVDRQRERQGGAGEGMKYSGQTGVNHYVFKLAMVVQAYNPSTWEAKEEHKFEAVLSHIHDPTSQNKYRS